MILDLNYLLNQKEINYGKRGLTEKEAAMYIDMSTAFSAQDRINGAQKNRTIGPAFVKLGRSVRYLREVLDK